MINTWLMIKVMELTISSLHSLRTRGPIKSRPTDLFGFNLSINGLTSNTDIWSILKSLTFNRTSKCCFRSLHDSELNLDRLIELEIFTKCSVKECTMSYLSWIVSPFTDSDFGIQELETCSPLSVAFLGWFIFQIAHFNSLSNQPDWLITSFIRFLHRGVLRQVSVFHMVQLF